MNINGQPALISFDTDPSTPAGEDQFYDLTNNQKALAFYYFLKICGVNPRETVDLSTIVRFMHLVLGIPYTSVQHSSIYRSLQSVPDLNNSKAFARDIACIQPFFAKVGLKDALQLMKHDLMLAQNR